jgi:WD40 repeat protein
VRSSIFLFALVACAAAPSPSPATSPSPPPGGVGLGAVAESPAQAAFVPQDGHADEVWRVAQSPDGKLLASGDFSGVVCVWTLAGDLLQSFEGHREAIQSLQFSPDGTELVSASRDAEVRVWSLTRAEGRLALPKAGGSASLSADGRTLATTAYDPVVRLWDVASGELLATRPVSARQTSALEYSPDGRWLAIADTTGSVHLWDAKTNEEKAVVAVGGSGLAWRPDGARLAVGSGDAIRIVDPTAGSVERTLTAPNLSPYTVAWSPDGSTLVSTDGGSWIHFWDPVRGRHLRALPGGRVVQDVLYVNDGTELLLALDMLPLLEIHRASDGELSRRLGSGIGDALVAEQSRDGRLVAAAAPGHGIDVWDVRRGTIVTTLPSFGDGWHALAFSPDAKLLAVAGERRMARLYDVATGKQVAAFDRPNPEQWAWRLGWSGDGRLLAVGLDQTVVLWSAAERKTVETLALPGPLRSDITFSPDGTLLGIGLDDGVELRDVAAKSWRTRIDLRAVSPLAQLHAFDFAPHGKTIITASQESMEIWDAATAALKDKVPVRTMFQQLAWSAQGDKLAFLVDRGTIGVFEPKPVALTLPSGRDDDVRALAFDPRGRLLVSSGDDGSVRVHDLVTRKTVAMAGRDPGRVWYARWHPSGDVIVASGARVRLHRAADGATLVLRSVPQGDASVGLVCSLDGIWSGDDGAVPMARLRDGRDLTAAQLLPATDRRRADLLDAFWSGKPLPR